MKHGDYMAKSVSISALNRITSITRLLPGETFMLDGCQIIGEGLLIQGVA